MDKTAVESAKSGLESMNKAWTDALAKANAVKSQAAEIMTKLGMPVPAALKS
jgi:hypothetical protein